MKLMVVVGFTLWIEYCMTAVTNNELAILKQMQDWGYSIFRSIKGGNERQYLVAVVLEDAPSPAKFAKHLLKGCPAEQSYTERLLECSTSAVILNKVSEEIWQRSEWHEDEKYMTRPWHGEYRLLLDGIVERLVTNFVGDNRNLKCQIYLYSFYIPCSQIQGMPYSCASLIANYNTRQTTQCKITLVGYSEVFVGEVVSTNYTASECTLTGVYIDLIAFTMEVQVAAIQNVQTEQVFQELMFKCLIYSPLSACCVDDENSREKRKLIVSYFVNAMMFALKQSETIANSNYNQVMKDIMLDEIHNWLFNNIGGDCVECSKYSKVPRYLIYFCAQTALDLSAHLGTPEDPYDLKTAKWKPLEHGKIYNINMIDPENFKNRVKLMCAHRSLSIDSLCTRMSHTFESNKRLKLG